MPEDLSNAKQQLEELDQLLKKMLDSSDPVSPRAEDETLPAFELPEIPRTPPIRRPRESVVSLNEFSLPGDEPSLTDSTATVTAEPEFVSVLDRPRRPPVLLMPFVGVDYAFESCTRPFGPLGRWLYGPTGKGLIAVVGFFLLAAAIAIGVLDWFGVTW